VFGHGLRICTEYLAMTLLYSEALELPEAIREVQDLVIDFPKEDSAIEACARE